MTTQQGPADDDAPWRRPPDAASDPTRAGEPKARPVEPQTRPVEPQTRPVEPQTRPVEPQTRPVEPQTRPVEPQTRPVKPDHIPWTRPDRPGGLAGDRDEAGAPEPLRRGPVDPAEVYQGPPPTSPPPAWWRPPLIVQPPPPRQLPDQDPAALDLEDKNARTFTYGVAMVTGAIMLVLTCLLCSRALF